MTLSDLKVSGRRTSRMHVLLSPDPGETKHQETGYPVLGSYFIRFRTKPTKSRVAETDGKVELDGLDGQLTSR